MISLLTLSYRIEKEKDNDQLIVVFVLHMEFYTQRSCKMSRLRSSKENHQL